MMGSSGTPGQSTGRAVNWKRAGVVLLVVVLSVLVFLGSSAWILLTGIQEELADEPDTEEFALTPEPRPNERINVLVLGVDAVQYWKGERVPRRSDTMMLVSVDPLTHEVGLLSIPRDTRVHMDACEPYKLEPSIEKINGAHAHGGPKFAMHTVSEFLEVPVHYYVRVDFEGFARIVDLLGGVEVDVEQDMDYEDPTQDLYIHIKAGSQHMDGATALNYVRYREDSDIERIGRQQRFLRLMLDRMLRVGSILRLPSLASEVAQYVETNIPTDKLLYLARFGTGIQADDLTTATVPGNPKWIEEAGGRVSYWVADNEALSAITDHIIWGIDREYNASLTVRVLNATHINGAAAELAALLEEQGFNVAEIGNAEQQDNPERTRIVNSYDDVLPGQIAARSVLQIVATAELFHSPGVTTGVPEPSITIYVGLDFPEDIRAGESHH